jgi:hypothetical protein
MTNIPFIKEKIDELHRIMNTNEHLTEPQYAMELTNRILLNGTLAPFWSVLSQEDRVYIQSAQHAIEQQMEWKTK